MDRGQGYSPWLAGLRSPGGLRNRWCRRWSSPARIHHRAARCGWNRAAWSPTVHRARKGRDSSFPGAGRTPPGGGCRCRSCGRSQLTPAAWPGCREWLRFLLSGWAARELAVCRHLMQVAHRWAGCTLEVNGSSGLISGSFKTIFILESQAGRVMCRLSSIE